MLFRAISVCEYKRPRGRATERCFEVTAGSRTQTADSRLSLRGFHSNSRKTGLLPGKQERNVREIGILPEAPQSTFDSDTPHGIDPRHHRFHRVGVRGSGKRDTLLLTHCSHGLAPRRSSNGIGRL